MLLTTIFSYLCLILSLKSIIYSLSCGFVIPRLSILTLAKPFPIIPISTAAARVRSIILRGCDAMRSFTLTTTNFLVAKFSTRSQVPILNLLVAQVSFFWLNVSPLDVLRPLNLLLYQVAVPIMVRSFSFFVPKLLLQPK